MFLFGCSCIELSQRTFLLGKENRKMFMAHLCTCNASQICLEVCRPNLTHSYFSQSCAGNQQEATYSEVKKPLKGKKKQTPVAGSFFLFAERYEMFSISCNVLFGCNDTFARHRIFCHEQSIFPKSIWPSQNCIALWVCSQQ